MDGVKIDVQSGVPAMGGGVGGGPYLARLYIKAMEGSVAESFGVPPTGSGGAAESGGGAAESGAAEAHGAVSPGAQCINCMCHSTETLYMYSTTALA